MPWSKEEKAEYHRAYAQSPAGKKKKCINQWKHLGIISDDWDALYERYLNTTHCEQCAVKLTGGKPRTRTTKCLDHDHSIKDRPNVRAVLCHACNVTDDSKNTSGVPNVSYATQYDHWRYAKVFNGEHHCKTFKTKGDAIRYKYKYEAENGIL